MRTCSGDERASIPHDGPELYRNKNPVACDDRYVAGVVFGVRSAKFLKERIRAACQRAMPEQAERGADIMMIQRVGMRR